MEEQIKGYTREGIEVRSDMCDLSFVLFAFEWTGFRASVSSSVDFNKTQTGKRRPYLAITIFGLLIQSGWLF